MDIYKKSNQNDFFDQLTRINSIRGITMALFEALKDEEIKKRLFLKYIFENNKENFDSFHGVLRFIRNTFSHNIRDKIKLEEKDYEKQKKYLSKRNKSTIDFSFDYSKYPFLLKIKRIVLKK